MSTIKVTNIEHGSTTDGGIQLDNTGHVTIDGQQFPTAGQLSNRNLIINGAMNVAQRGTSSTSSGIQTIDRFNGAWNGGAVTQTQETLTSGDPYNEGFRKFARLQNTTTSTGASDYRELLYKFEAQDLAQSGWQYTSATSYITVSFWVRSSVAQTYYGFFMSRDGTDQVYSFPFTLTANTWTKVTETISGDSDIQIDNDNGDGGFISFVAFYGTSYTDSGNTDRTWRARTSGNDYLLDMTNTWANTTNATFDVTGVQVEVGEKATPFEHRSYGDELARCQRYYYRHAEYSSGGSVGIAAFYQSSRIFVGVHFPTTMRAQPTLDASDFTNAYRVFRNGGNEDFDGWANVQESGLSSVIIESDSTLSATGGQAGWCRLQTSPAQISFSAEL